MEETASKAPRIVYRNTVRIKGRVLEEPGYTNEKGGIRFYETKLSVYRLSDKADTIPVILPESLLVPDTKYEDQICEVHGHFRSYNQPESDRVHLKLSVYAKEILLPGDERLTNGANVVRERNPWNESTEDINEVVLEGYLCRPSAYRRTPMGREITDFLLGVPRLYSRSDFIPCIAWGCNAKLARDLTPGTRVLVKGRIQSRFYIKEIPDGSKELRQAFELSVFELYRLPPIHDEKQEKNDGFCQTKYLE